MIRQVSVDDRLLHGQVAFYWTSYYNLDMILVLNDEAANDEFTKMILGLAKPREVRLQIAEVEAGFEIVRRQLESPDNVLIIVGSLFDANQVLEHFRELKTLNLGGLRMRPNGKVLNERTALTSEDITICRRLLERKIMITVRHSPEVAESLLTESVLKQL